MLWIFSTHVVGKVSAQTCHFSRVKIEFLKKGKMYGFTKGGVWKFYTSNDLDNSEELENAEDWIIQSSQIIRKIGTIRSIFLIRSFWITQSIWIISRIEISWRIWFTLKTQKIRRIRIILKI